MNNSLLFFSKADLTLTLWKMDLVTEMTRSIKTFTLGFDEIGSVSASRVGERLFFTTSVDNNSDALWISDGTTNGTTRIQIFAPGPTTGPGGQVPSIQHLTVAGQRLFFTAYTVDGGPALWVTDGTVAGTIQLTTSNLQSTLIDGAGPAALGDRAFFFVNQNGNPTLW